MCVWCLTLTLCDFNTTDEYPKSTQTSSRKSNDNTIHNNAKKLQQQQQQQQQQPQPQPQPQPPPPPQQQNQQKLPDLFP